MLHHSSRLLTKRSSPNGGPVKGTTQSLRALTGRELRKNCLKGLADKFVRRFALGSCELPAGRAMPDGTRLCDIEYVQRQLPLNVLSGRDRAAHPVASPGTAPRPAGSRMDAAGRETVDADFIARSDRESDYQIGFARDLQRNASRALSADPLYCS